jgi:hypothetical protein
MIRRPVHWWRRIVALTFIVGVGVVIVSPDHSGAQVTGLWLLGVPIALTALWCSWRVFRLFLRALDSIFQPVPSPTQIAIQLQASWGRPPTVVEVAAVRQMLIDEHNQRLINGGLALSAAYLIGHYEH